MNKIVGDLPKRAGYKMENTYFNICFADDAVLIADSEDDLHRLLHSFNQSAWSLTQTKPNVTYHQKSQLEIDQEIVEQVNQFKYFKAEITSYENLRQRTNYEGVSNIKMTKRDCVEKQIPQHKQ